MPRVCSSKLINQTKFRKGHTQESKQGKKYAPGSETDKKEAYPREQAKEKVCPGKRN